MRAAVLEAFNRPLGVNQVADPVPGPGDVIVRTRAAGVCRTDLKIIEGAISTVQPPLVMGHELAGEVAALGQGVRGVEVGTRVAVSLDFSCGVCAYCRRGELDYCANLGRLGIEHDGALAEFVRVPAANLIELPETISFAQGATIADAVGSSYHAVRRRADVRAGQTVAVYGLGGLGLVAVQVAALAGAKVIGIARTEERRILASRLGATWTIDPNEGDVSAQIKELTAGFGVDAFIDLVGIEGSAQEGLLSCRRGGRVVVVGYMIPELTAQMMRLVYDEVSIMGSRSSTRADLLEAVAMVASGRIEPIIGTELELDAVNESLDLLRQGSVVGRAIVTFD
jgi:D-arabinose 1-dehydrogenase-like Zn-dependent alcohol dehydrogenase